MVALIEQERLGEHVSIEYLVQEGSTKAFGFGFPRWM